MMALRGFKRPAIGNNPLSFAAPVKDRVPFVFDMAASEAAFAKIIEAKRGGKPIPDGWALDKDGNPTADSAKAFEGMLLPVGGAKGMGVAMMLECLAGALTGTDPAKLEGVPGLPAAFGGFLMVFDP
jgi:LDH2 family malate/lactate/ureidoglycolate dehydrogenase